MTHVALTVLIAATLPFLFTGIAKVGAFTLDDNRRTRDWQATLTGWRQRAHWAHQNSFEAFPAFAAAAILALLSAPQSGLVPILCWAFIGARLAYGVCYIKDWARARSLVWFSGLSCVVALFLTALTRG
jgi:uncharacterized MAPEG superfamily protein